ncbi:putative cadmium-transporting ATPase [Symmachiella macrocystis]|uniref:P-type Zn(2+) transporter n=1 Tax=Symmachiella macrocystis TaxID=2527985 RepID=A0A5C6BJN1_9PLAN|nr:heavy metal translocating P-type ATPase [Symmachiella macrocystis]TWU11877.1 putative cadmium-transporting ATPase [Symmachiella macrocystis]
MQGQPEESDRPRSVRTAQFRVAELDCAEEIRQLEQSVGRQPGIVELKFDIFKNRMTAIYDQAVTDPEQIITRISEIGMRAQPWAPISAQHALPWWKQWPTWLATLSAASLIIGTTIQFTHAGDSAALWISRTAYMAAILAALWQVAPKAWAALSRRQPDMNLLMTVAVIGAIAINEWFEAATVSFLFCVALLLEHWSMGRARRAISALMDLSPPTARRIDAAGNAESLPVEEIVLGALISVRPGEKIPLDGVIRSGQSAINEAPITGESRPVDKQPGQEVFAGTINEDGALEIEVTHIAADSTLARIAQMVEEAQAARAPSQQWVERFAQYYTPAMMALALTVAVIPPLLFAANWSEWIYRGLVVLVIACPCALVISTPVSIVSALTAAAHQGVLIKGGRHLESCATIQTIAFDKTGTITVGKPVVQSVTPLNSYSHKQLLEVASALEAQSSHPIASAIRHFAAAEEITSPTVEDHQLLSGRGVVGNIAGEPYWIGSHRLVHEQADESPGVHEKAMELEQAGHSVIAVGTRKQVIGLISVADAPREIAAQVLVSLREAGVKRIDILTGDNQATAEAVAQIIAADNVKAECLPEDKLNYIQQLSAQGEGVAMVGDGVNDAPALAAATVGIAMAAMGTDTAIETADVALMSDDLSRIPWLIRHARRTLTIVRQNIVFALGLKVLFIILTLFGEATLWMAIAADMGASLLVIFNGLRLLNAAERSEA